MSVTIILADDHDLVRKGVGALLRNEPDFEVVDECSTGLELLELVERWHPAVVIVDVALSRLDGIETTKRIRALSRLTRIIVLARYSDGPYIRGLLKAGISAYVLKSGLASDLIHAVRHSTPSNVHLSPEVAELAGEAGKADLGSSKAITNGAKPLSPRQLEVLRMIAEGYSSKRMAATLGIGESTVKSHRKNLMEKLNIHDKVGLARHAIRIGLTLDK
jgi:two-component system, NarL family, response regulator NreC